LSDSPLRAAFLFQLVQRRKVMGKGNRVRTKHPRPVRVLYPWTVEVKYAAKIAKALAPLVAYTEEYVNKHAESVLRGDHADEAPGPGFRALWSTLNGYVGQEWPDDPGKAPPSVTMGINDTGEDTADWAVKEWAKQTKAVLGISFTDAIGPWWPDVKKQWATENYKLIKSLSGDYIDKVNRLTEKAIKNGWTAKSLTQEIMATGANITKARARLIARDQIGKLNSAITHAQHTDIGLDVYSWSTSLDERVRGNPGGKYPDAVPSHYAMEGKLFRHSDPSVTSLDSGKTWIPRPSDFDEGEPGEPIQCFSGETIVRSLVPANKIFRYEHHGPAAVLIAGVDKPFVVTLNHPILTERGWVPAKFLEVGDNLIVTSSQDFDSIFMSNKQNSISSFEELFGFASIVGLHERIAGSATDFYGDGPVDKEIEIVSLEGELPDYVIRDGEQCLINEIFARINIALTSLMSDSKFSAMVVALGLPFDSGMSCLCKLLSLFGSQSSHTEDIRLGAVSRLDSILAKYAINDDALNSKVFRELQDALTRIVLRDDLGFRHFYSIWRTVSPSKSNSARSIQLSLEPSVINSDNLADFGKRKSIFPHSICLIEKRLINLVSHVYTLETKNGWYLVTNNNIVVQNCRCTALADFSELISEADSAIGDEPAEPPPAPEQSAGPYSAPFVPASTVAAAGKWAVDHAIASMASYKGAELGVANEWNRVIYENLRDFPRLRDGLQFIGTTQERQRKYVELYMKEHEAEIAKSAKSYGMPEERYREIIKKRAVRAAGKTPGHAWAYATSDPLTAGIDVNTNYGKDEALLTKSIKYCVGVKFHPVGCDSIKAVIDHELGHRLDALLGWISEKPEFEEVSYKYVNELAKAQGIRMVHLDPAYRKLVTDELSEYALENRKEFLAEAWSEYRNNPNPRPLAKKIGELVEQQYRLLYGAGVGK
jgi:hypothetical protein